MIYGIFALLRIDPALLVPSAGPRAFISYAREDRRIAVRLELGLRQHGILPWVDVSQRLLGTLLAENIARAVGAAHTFIVLISRSSVESKWVRLEIEYALQAHLRAGVRILPVLLDGTPAPSALEPFWSEVVQEWDEESIARIGQSCREAWAEMRVATIVGESSGKG